MEALIMNCDSLYGSASPKNFTGLTASALFGANFEPLGKAAAKISPLLLEPVTVAGENGSEFTIDQANRVIAFSDAAGRSFKLSYDDNRGGQIASLTDERGLWLRELRQDGGYLDKWNDPKTGQYFEGTVQIDRNGLCVTDRSNRTTYASSGVKTIDRFLGSEHYLQIREDAQGNKSFEDLREGLITYEFVDGRRAVRRLADGSLLGYDARGNLTVMQDAAKRRFEFDNYDEEGMPQTVVNERGRWTKISHQLWCNEQSGKYWYGTVEVQRNGAYKYVEVSGKETIRYANGFSVEEYAGIRTLTDPYGRRTRQYTDGQDFIEPPLTATSRFSVKNGVVSDCKLHLQNGKLSKDDRFSDDRVSISMAAQSAITAIDDGAVVYSTRSPERNDQRRHAVVPLSDQDLFLIDSFQSMGAGKDIVVVQCFDKVHRSLRYEIYAGLEQANVVIGDKVKAGQPIGRLAQDGALQFGVRVNSVSGKSLPISLG